MPDEAMRRLLDYDRRRYWLANGWSIRFRIAEAAVTTERPHGIRYSFTLHNVDRTRLLGFDNAHGLPRVQAYDHRHRFRRTAELVPYQYQGADELICDFFAAVEMACGQEGVRFEFEAGVSSWNWRMTMARKNLAELREEMRAVARGDRHAAALRAAPLLAALSREALDLLGVILRERPATIADLVSSTGRAQPNVSRSLQQLAGHGLIRLDREGREVRPVPLAREVRVDLTTGTCATVPVHAAAS